MDVPAGVAINAHRALNTQSGSHGTGQQPDAMAFKNQLESCLYFFRDLIEAMVRFTKESAFAGPYFHPIIRTLDGDLVRIEIWASDLGANEEDFGRLTQDGNPDLELTRFITTILKDLQSQLEDSERQVEKMRSLIRKMSGRRLNDWKLDRQLRGLVSKFDEEFQKVTLAIRSLVNLTEAFQVELVTKLKSGPYANLRQKNMEAMGQNLTLPPPSPGGSSASSVDVLTPENQGPWSRKTLLSLDEGGTRNFSSLLILQALMAEIAAQERTTEPQAYSSASPLSLKLRAVKQTKEEPQQQLQFQETFEHTGNQDAELSRYLPCHYFDYTIGTGFGGLIAIMLSRLRMNVEETLEEFQTLLDSIWSLERFHTRLYLPIHYDYKVLEREIKNIVSRKVPDANADTTFKQHNDDTSRCIVGAHKIKNGPNHISLFRSYHHPIAFTANPMRKGQRNEAEPKPYTIWQVARAATAAPMYFAPITLREGIEAGVYYSSALVETNPSSEGYVSVRQASGNGPASVISIGSGANTVHEMGQGRRSTTTNIARYRQLLQYSGLLRPRTANNVHLEMRHRQSTQGLNFYNRFNVEVGIAFIRQNLWYGNHGNKTLKYIRKVTESYLSSETVKKEITEAARVLVETRRARATTDHWEYFCHGVEYVCTMTRCPDSSKVYRKRDELRRHLEDFHHLDLSTIETMLDRGKRFPLYEAKSKDY